MPTIRQLQYFIALADLKHFGRAAGSLNVSQPTLSQQLRALEAQLGVTLVERGETPVQLTPVGRELAERSRKIMLQIDDLQSLAKRSAGGMVGTIRFGVTPTLGPYLMPSIIASLHKSAPDMRLYIREGIPSDQLQELRRGALDMMLVPLPVGGSDLHIEPLFREKLHLVAPPDHPLCQHSIIHKSDLAGSQILSLDPRHLFHQQAGAIAEELGAELLRDYEGTSLDSLRQMSGSGLGLAILPEFYLRSEVGGVDMVTRLSVTDWSATRSIAAVWRQSVAYEESYAMIANMIATEARTILQEALQ